ncbi:MAG: YybH family protein [Flammeovirgaceae bacterium]
MQRTLFLFLAFFVLAATSQAQEKNKLDFSKQVDKQVWKPFKKAYAARNAEQFNALHTDDVLRITKSGIRKGDEYKENNLKWFNTRTEKRTIDLRFEQRHYKEDVAYEVGYYKVINYSENEEAKVHYGRFHVVLRKVKGVWKIAQDWDTDDVNGTPVTEADWEKLAG